MQRYDLLSAYINLSPVYIKNDKIADVYNEQRFKQKNFSPKVEIIDVNGIVDIYDYVYGSTNGLKFNFISSIKGEEDNGGIQSITNENPWQKKLYNNSSVKKVVDLFIPKKGTKE